MSNFTKNAIKASFLKLLNERPLSKITIKDIVTDCGINRNSFYYHYQDIPSLIEEVIKEETDNIISLLGIEWQSLMQSSNTRVYGVPFLLIQAITKSVSVI